MGNLCSQKYKTIQLQSQRVKQHRMTIIGQMTGSCKEKQLLGTKNRVDRKTVYPVLMKLVY